MLWIWLITFGHAERVGHNSLVNNLITAHKRSLRRLCFHSYLSVHWGVSLSVRDVSVQGSSLSGGSLSRGICPGGSLSRRASLSKKGLCPRGSPSEGVSVQRGSLSRGVSVWEVSVQGESLSRGRSLSKGGLCLGSLCPEGISVQGALCPRGGLCPWGLSGESLFRGVSVRETPRTETPQHTVTSGRYASYWNEFLFITGLVSVLKE